MKFNRISKKLLTLVCLLTACFSAIAFAKKEPEHYMIDILYLQEGKTFADVNEYFKRIEPVAKKHGLVRVQPSLEVTKLLTGIEEAPHSVNIWKVADPKTTLPNISNDPEYQKHISRRNSTFEMSKTILFFAKPVK